MVVVLEVAFIIRPFLLRSSTIGCVICVLGAISFFDVHAKCLSYAGINFKWLLITPGRTTWFFKSLRGIEYLTDGVCVKKKKFFWTKHSNLGNNFEFIILIFLISYYFSNFNTKFTKCWVCFQNLLNEKTGILSPWLPLFFCI